MTGRAIRIALRSGWPRGAIDELLRAVTLHDEAAAAAAWRSFEFSADFDSLTAGEFRLISLAAKRMAALAPESPLRPRIAGVERAIWSRSQLAISEAGPALRALQAAEVDMLVIKGASRAASADAAARGRAVNDVDICVHPDDMQRAFDILTGEGWMPSGSGTILFHRSRLADVVGINLVRGKFGNIDLHRAMFHPPFNQIDCDASIWDRSRSAKLAYCDVRVPSPTDSVAVALAHGALDAHKSSDWLVDMAASVDAGIDWRLLEEIIDRRGMQAPAAIALGYLRERLDRPVPAELLERIGRVAARKPLVLLAAVAEVRPKSGALHFFWFARTWAKQSRLLRRFRSAPRRGRLVLASIFPARGGNPGERKAAVYDLHLPGRRPGDAWSGTIDMTLLVELPAASRRVDFEVNAGFRHLVRLRAFVRDRGSRDLALRFRFSMRVASTDPNPVIAAAPSRSFNADAPRALVDKYRAVPFSVVEVVVRERGGAETGATGLHRADRGVSK